MNRLWTKALSLVAAFLLGVALTGVATGHSGTGQLIHSGHDDTMNGTLTAQGFKFKRMRMTRLAIPGTAFNAAGGSEEPNLGIDGGGAYLTEDAVAPVLLPHGASLLKMEWFHRPTDDGGELQLIANQRDGTSTPIAATTATECPGDPCSNIDTITHTVNNNGRTYQLSYGPGSEENVIYAVVITYKVRTPGPG